MTRRRGLAVAAPSQFATGLSFRIARGIIILVVVLAVVLCAAAGFLTYRIVSDHNDIEDVTPASYLGSASTNLNFADPAGGEHEGWLLHGLRGAPVIILCHGYNSNRSELLSLGQLLRENHFNVYLFNFRNAKAQESSPILGVRQIVDVQAAINTLVKQPSVNPHRVGLFGTSTGAYAALIAASKTPYVKAIAVDTAANTPEEMFDAEVDRRLGGSSPLFRFLAEADYHILTFRSKPPVVSEALPKLGDMPKLFITGEDTPALATITRDLYNRVPEPKRLLTMQHSQTTLTSGAEKKEFENQLVSFFLQNLPLRAD